MEGKGDKGGDGGDGGKGGDAGPPAWLLQAQRDQSLFVGNSRALDQDGPSGGFGNPWYS